jgi:hypothetical protein
VHVTPPAVTVSVHPYDPGTVYECVAFCCVDVCPSPNVQAYVGLPEQFVAVAVPWKAWFVPVTPFAGTVAVHVTVHVAAAPASAAISLDVRARFHSFTSSN